MLNIPEFRGKVKEGYKDAGKWIYFTLEDFIDFATHDDSFDIVNLRGIDKTTISQYTGLKDIRGKKIFDGDIAYLLKNGEYSYTDTLKETKAVVIIQKHDKEPYYITRELNIGFVDIFTTDGGSLSYEVIGNKWGTPELLKGLE